jgi:hypothetical protein
MVWSQLQNSSGMLRAWCSSNSPTAKIKRRFSQCWRKQILNRCINIHVCCPIILLSEEIQERKKQMILGDVRIHHGLVSRVHDWFSFHGDRWDKSNRSGEDHGYRRPNTLYYIHSCILQTLFLLNPPTVRRNRLAHTEILQYISC